MTNSDHKTKLCTRTKNQFNKSIHMVELCAQKPSDQVKEDFFRPAYGKIGDRRIIRKED